MRTGNDVGSRVLLISVDDTNSPPTDAEMTKSWLVMNYDATEFYECPHEGSGELVPADTGNDTVLAMCDTHYTIEELNQPDGSEASPTLLIELPEDPCTGTSEPTDRTEIGGWYRAFPLTHVGDF